MTWIDRDGGMNDVNGRLVAALATLLGTAEATKLEETAVRRATAMRIAELEMARVKAYRRHHLVHLLGSATAGAPDRETALAAQTAALAARLDWGEGLTPEQRETIGAMEPLMTRVADVSGVPSPANADPIASHEMLDPADIVAALETFEQWFATRFEGDFFRVFERHAPDARGTDF